MQGHKLTLQIAAIDDCTELEKMFPMEIKKNVQI